MIYSLILSESTWATRGTSDTMSETSAISEVQNSEKKAAESVMHAEEWRKTKVAEAHEKAKKIIEEAETESRAIREDAVSKGLSLAAIETKKMMAEAERAAARIKKSRPAASALKGIANDIVNEITGE